MVDTLNSIVYGHTARMLAKLLYGDCDIALDRKLSQAQEMNNSGGQVVIILVTREDRRCKKKH
jgi:uncharacterized protein YheU (UPF0270 family)